MKLFFAEITLVLLCTGLLQAQKNVGWQSQLVKMDGDGVFAFNLHSKVSSKVSYEITKCSDSEWFIPLGREAQSIFVFALIYISLSLNLFKMYI